MRTSRLLLISLLISLSWMLSGCAGPLPQRVTLQPEVTSVPRLPKSVPLNVEVQYPHRQLKIGTIADRVGNETMVSVTDNISGEIRRAAINTLNRMGVNASDNMAPTRLTLTLEQIHYNHRSDGIRRELIGVMKIRMQASDGRRQYNGTFEAEKREEVLRTPSEQKSREFMNELASDVLTQAFNDPNFTRFLIEGAL
ncbi:YajG family lipoprotein [Nitrincola tapanii]|uniref:YajG family lipoprotein n=1 Tax=Nitrincola tapanii TaxID=1708751 RepID=UPI001359DD04|nr:YajG family lipoprotein [Nitrincola tapanii]